MTAAQMLAYKKAVVSPTPRRPKFTLVIVGDPGSFAAGSSAGGASAWGQLGQRG
jgi:hypothetical protein